MEVKPALFLDLDGTVRYSKNGEFINSPDDVAVYDGVLDKIMEYKDNGYLIFAITNQGGVAFGFKTILSHLAEVERMLELMGSDPFDLICSCFFHEKGTVAPYNMRSLRRKPQIGMLVDCEIHAHGLGIVLDYDNSLIVGDRPEDKQLAVNADVNFMYADNFFGRLTLG